MRFKMILAAGFGLVMAGTAPTLAQDYTSVSVTQVVLTNVTVTSGSYAAQASSQGAKIYPHHGENFCPAGLQPVTISGVVCCGVPNQNMSYQQAKMTPAAPRKVVKRSVVRRQAACQVGTKGCTYD